MDSVDSVGWMGWMGSMGSLTENGLFFAFYCAFVLLRHWRYNARRDALYRR
ncbi:MAG: hypothetical protein WDN28_05540 [Chthoniobacter sp.]